ncbi:MAG: M23 family metallopeptidase [Deltaproteobacteria bacterium]|nr:M23 family metallopeptidase [Deltaproteobacteria bacterium]
MAAHKHSSGQPMFFGRKLAVVVVVALVPVLAYLLWAGMREGPAPQVELTSDLPAVGQATTLTITVKEPSRGLSSLKVLAGGPALKTPVTLLEQSFEPAPAHKPWVTPATTETTVTVVVGKRSMPELVPGQLVVRVVAGRAGTWMRQPAPAEVERSFEVRLQPPALTATSSFVHPSQGGAEALVYEVGPSSVKDGVAVGDWFFPGAPLPGGAPSQRVVLFAVPYDLEVSEAEAKERIKLVAVDDVGNGAEQRFVHKFFPRPMGKDTIGLKDTFMKKVAGEIYARTPELTQKGSLVDDYLQLNGDLRRANNATLKELAAKSVPKFLWSQTFQPMQNAAVKGSFADRRAYMFEGKQVDTQDHLGFDLASLERAPVQAANAGTVVLARYFGIFGNAVVIDHGFGLQTLYAHLSSIGAKEGDAVARGQEIGRTGATGLAGGDHLHFTTVLHGLPVNPIEWWDAHWIRDRLKLKLGDALPWAEQAPVPPAGAP